MNGGRMTEYFERTRGVRQGCPLSPSLFILTVELLALKIRQRPNRRGIRLPNGKEVRILQFADDTNRFFFSYELFSRLSYCYMFNILTQYNIARSHLHYSVSHCPFSNQT